MMWMILYIAMAAVIALLLRAYLAQETELAEARLVAEEAERDRYRVSVALAEERGRNRDLARENNRLKVEAKNRQRVPQDVIDAYESADGKNVSPRLDVESIGPVRCVPLLHWESLGRRIRGIDSLPASEATRVDL